MLVDVCEREGVGELRGREGEREKCSVFMCVSVYVLSHRSPAVGRVMVLLNTRDVDGFHYMTTLVSYILIKI